MKKKAALSTRKSSPFTVNFTGNIYKYRHLQKNIVSECHFGTLRMGLIYGLIYFHTGAKI